MLDFSRAMCDWRAVTPRPVPRQTATKPAAAKGSLAPTIVIVVLILGALATLLWTGLRDLPSASPSRTEPTILVPAPVITGGLTSDQPVDSTEPPAAVPRQEAPAIVPQQEAEPRAMPTIAPVVAAPATQAEIAVPNVVGLTFSGATQALGPLGLPLVPGQPVFSDSTPFNAVAEQDPPAGSLVDRGARIRVALSRGPSPFADEP